MNQSTFTKAFRKALDTGKTVEVVHGLTVKSIDAPSTWRHVFIVEVLPTVVGTGYECFGIYVNHEDIVDLFSNGETIGVLNGGRIRVYTPDFSVSCGLFDVKNFLLSKNPKEQVIAMSMQAALRS